MNEIESHKANAELALYHEYRDIINIFQYVVKTERRFYLANDVDVRMHTSSGGKVFFEVSLFDARVWDIYRASRSIRSVHIVTFEDVNVEEFNRADITRELDLPYRRRAAGLTHGRPVGLPHDLRAAVSYTVCTKFTGDRMSVRWHGL